MHRGWRIISLQSDVDGESGWELRNGWMYREKGEGNGGCTDRERERKKECEDKRKRRRRADDKAKIV